MSCFGLHLRHVLPALLRVLPARRLQPLQLIGHALEGEGRRAALRPHRVAVEMVAVVVGVEDVLHRLRRDAFGVGHRSPRPARKIRVHHDEVVLHLDDHVVAMAQVLDVALAEPHTRRHHADRFRNRVRTRGEKGKAAQGGKRHQEERS
jgi:hypothetical protein